MILLLLFGLFVLGIAEGAYIIYLGLSMKGIVLNYLENILALTTATKEYAKSSDTHNKIAARLVQETKAASAESQAAEIARRAAEAVVDKLKSNDSGVSLS